MSLFTDFRLSVMENNLGVYGIHVFQKGKALGEHRFRSNDRENLYSASKTFASVGVGIAEEEGLFQLTDKVLDFFPEYQAVASPGSVKITIRDLLHMSSGHLSEDYGKHQTKDIAELFFRSTMVKEPGSAFFYEDLSTYILGRMVEKVSGKTMLEYLTPRLFDKLGIENPQWHTCPLGHTSCSGGLYLTTEEFSRIGIMLLQKGMYNSQKIVSKDYVLRMHTDLVDTASKDDPETRQGYGYQVWNCTEANTYRADGMYGQLCVVFKDYSAVVTVTAHNETNHKEILRAIWKDIVPELM